MLLSKYELHLFYRFRRYKSIRSQHVCLLVSLHLQYEPCDFSSIFPCCFGCRNAHLASALLRLDDGLAPYFVLEFCRFASKLATSVFLGLSISPCCFILSLIGELLVPRRVRYHALSGHRSCPGNDEPALEAIYEDFTGFGASLYIK